MKIVTSQQMRRIEERSEVAGVSTDTLMENAGLVVAKCIRRHLGRVTGARVAVLVGPGNNGGDGLVAARHLHAWGALATVYLCTDRPADDEKLAALSRDGAPVVRATADDGLARLRELLDSAQLVLDAMLGTGRSRPIEGVLEEVLRGLTEAKARRPGLRVIALDLPSGLDADTGAIDPSCPTADITATLGYPKVGLFMFPGAERTGGVEIMDIGVPAGLDEDIQLELMTDAWARDALPERPLSAHKGTFGRALVVAGSREYVGAAYLAATAAARSGAGLVTLAIPESLQTAVAAKAVEPIYLPLAESSPGVLSQVAADQIIERLPGYDALLVGCGVGQALETLGVIERLLYSDRPMPPTVVDADGLNCLARSRDPGWWTKFEHQAIVTPHPGEMARLTGRDRRACPRRAHRAGHRIGGEVDQGRRAQGRIYGGGPSVRARDVEPVCEPGDGDGGYGGCPRRGYRRAPLPGAEPRGRCRAWRLRPRPGGRERSGRYGRYRHACERPPERPPASDERDQGLARLHHLLTGGQAAWRT